MERIYYCRIVVKQHIDIRYRFIVAVRVEQVRLPRIGPATDKHWYALLAVRDGECKHVNFCFESVLAQISFLRKIKVG